MRSSHQSLFCLFLTGVLLSAACHSTSHHATGPRTDAAIESDIRAALAKRVEQGKAIEVSVVDRTVTLAGHVLTTPERDKAGAAARGIEGVKTVINNLTAE